jgi:negative elongation factor C/D
MFIDALFKPGVKINLEHKPKYIYIVSYASSVVETWKKVCKQNEY